MNKNLNLCISLGLLLVAAPLGAMADTLTNTFTDTFTNGSTLNSATPANPTPTNTAYELVANKSWNPAPTIAANDLKFGIAATTSGYIQAQALFATNAVALVEPGDFIQLTVTFTNTTGLLTAAGQLGFGLFNSGQVKPVAGGMNNSVPATFTGFAQNWAGYNANINFTGAASRISTRPAQTGSTIANQDLFTFGTSSSYAGGTALGTATGNATLTAGGTYTEVFTITLNGTSSVAITNVLYSGPTTSGTVITNFGAVATNANFITGGFDSMVIGYCGRGNTGGAPLFDISSISVYAITTVITGPPTITLQPVSITVATNGSCAFLVNAQGFDVTYQWKRNGTNLLNQDNISGATGSGGSSLLAISPAGLADAGTNLYYVTVTGAGGYSTNSVTNLLTLIPATTLYYGSGSWDVNNSASWDTADTGNANVVFNFGDPVNFTDNGGGTVTLNGSYLSAASATVSQTPSFLTWTGTGSFAGPGNLIYNGSAQFTINNANTYSGGTIISNANANLKLGNLQGLGTGPITMALAGGKMEIIPASSSTTSIASDLNVQDDFTIIVDATNTSFGVVLNGNLSGLAGKTLTINHPAGSIGTNATRIRINGTSTVYNANLVLGGSGDTNFVWSPSQGSGSQTYNGVISGPGTFLQKSSTTYLNNLNTYSGGTIPAAGAIGLGTNSVGSPTVTAGPIGTGPLLLLNDSTTSFNTSAAVFASGGACTVANVIQYRTATNNLTLIFAGTNDLTLSGAFSLQGNDGFGAGTNRTIQVTNTGASTLSGVISDGGLGIGLIKTGSGSLYLNGNNTYGGLTTVNNGTTNGLGLLAGSGTIAGSVLVQTNYSAVGGGTASAIGTLTIGGGLTNNGNVFIRVNKSLSPAQSNDVISVTGTITNTGVGTVLVSSNGGPALVAGNRLYLFNKAMSNGAAMTVTGGGISWSNYLAVDGSILAVSGADLGVQLAGPASVSSSSSISYTLTLTNAGPGVANSVTLTDSLLTNVTFVSASNGGTTNGNVRQVVWSGLSFAPNTATNFTVTVNAPVSGTVTNTASVSSPGADPNPANDSATLITTITTTIIPNVSAHIGSFTMSGTNVVIGGTNGVNGGTYYLLASTNVATPLGQWTTVATNIVNTNGASGAFTFTGTNVVTPGGQQFYILSNTNNH